MHIDIKSYHGEKFLSDLVGQFEKGFDLTNSIVSKDYISLNLPIGKIKCSYLNSGLTIGLAELNENTPSILGSYSGDEEEIPYKIGFCFEGEFELNYPNQLVQETIRTGRNFIITPRKGSSIITKGHEKLGFFFIFISPTFLNTDFNIDRNKFK
ncbi:hypothetical protein, partial [Xanthovirga aplysinae]|uniref:hypothetical protein n=1 Tax=Xanthovirga aplysinae TaxID=2529853 RepID=UPI00165737B1